jgi:adenine phosphoribosyltransferase
MSVLNFTRIVPNFPKEGIIFQDLSPIFKNHFPELIEECADCISQIEEIDCFVGVESRGFIIASALAQKFAKGFVMIRKKGKLPPPNFSQEYSLEYGTDTIEMQEGFGKICIIDDVLATGGTLEASCKLAEKCGYDVREIFCILNISALNNFEFKGIKPKILKII